MNDFHEFKNADDIINQILALIQFAYNTRGICWELNSEDYIANEDFSDLESLKIDNKYVLTYNQIKFIIRIIDDFADKGTKKRKEKINKYFNKFEKRKIPISIYSCLLLNMY